MARLNKRVAIARSGVYVYSAGALPGLGLSVPPEKKSQQSFGVFRPPEVLIRAKDKFTKLPVTLEHPPRLIDGNNFREFAQGYTGDSAEAVEMSDGHNVMICSTLTLADNESISAYYRGVVEVSPGYKGTFYWEDGVSPDGEHYDIVMEDITEVNHLALTRRGRGGPSACVLDSREVMVTKRKSGLFYAIYKRMRGVQDSKEDGFTETLSDLIANNRKMDDDAIGKAVGRLSIQVDYLPDSADKAVLSNYVSDLIGMREESDEANKQAAIMIGNLYARLDSQTMASVVADAYDEEESKKPVEQESDKEDAKDDESKQDSGDDNKEESKSEVEEKPETETALDAPVVGPDDSIYDKKFDELTPQEKDFVWSELMAMLKCHELEEQKEEAPTEKPVDEEAKETPSEEEAEHSEQHEEVVDGDKEESKEEEKSESVSDSLESGSTEPRYPDSTSIAGGKKAIAQRGVNIDELLSSLKNKGGR